MKKIIAFLMIGFTALFMAACDGDEKDKKEPWEGALEVSREKYEEEGLYNVDKNDNNVADWKEEKVTIRFAPTHYWFSPEDNSDLQFSGFKPVVDAFMKKYPNITVEFSNVLTGLDDAQQLETLSAMAVDDVNSVPEVFQVNDPAATGVRNMAADLTPYLTTDEDYAKYVPAAFKASMENVSGSELISVPWGSAFQVVMINTSLLEEYNVAVPGQDWTYEDYQAAREKILSATKAGTCVFPGTIDFTEIGATYFDGTGFGYKGFDLENDKFKLAEATKFGEWLQEMADESSQGYDFPTLSDEQKESKCPGISSPWNSGLMAFQSYNSWDYAHNMKEIAEVNPEDKYVLYPFPKAPEGGYTTTRSYTDHIGVYSGIGEGGKAENLVKAEAAAELVKWITFSTEGLTAKYNAIYDGLHTPIADNYLGTTADHINDFHMGWPISTNEEVLKLHPMVKGFTAEQLNAENLDQKIKDDATQLEKTTASLVALKDVKQDMFASDLFKEQMSQATIYTRWILGFKNGADNLKIWEHIRDVMNETNASYKSVAETVDAVANQNVEEAKKQFTNN